MVSHPKEHLKKEQSSVSLPPIDTTSVHSLVIAKSDISEREEKDDMCLHVISKKSDTALIVEAAKRARENLIAGIPSPKKVLTKMTSFTTPRMSVSRNSSSRSKYIVPPSKTTVMDIEGAGEVSDQNLKDSIPCGKSHSHPHLNNSNTPSPRRAKLSEKLTGGGVGMSFKKPFLSEASLRRVRDGRTVVTIDELEKLTRRSVKSSSMHNTPVHHSKALRQSTANKHSSHHRLGLSPSRQPHKDTPSKSLAILHKSIANRTAAAMTTVITKEGRRITVRRALPQPPPLRRKQSPRPRRQLVPNKGRLDCRIT